MKWDEPGGGGGSPTSRVIAVIGKAKPLPLINADDADPEQGSEGSSLRQSGMTSAHPRENRAWTGPVGMKWEG